MDERNRQQLKITEFLSGGKISADTVINEATAESSPLFTPGGITMSLCNQFACLSAQRGRLPYKVGLQNLFCSAKTPKKFGLHQILKFYYHVWTCKQVNI